MTSDELDKAFDGLSKIEESAPPRLLYHYTSVFGLGGVVSTRQIWASHFAFMNDPAELRHADEHVHRAVELLRPMAKGVGRIVLERFIKRHPAERVYNDFDLFVACFSEDADSLPQWRAYADNGRGYAVGLDTTYGGTEALPVPCGIHGDYVVDMYKVEYSAQKLSGEFNQFLQKLLSTVAQCEQGGAPAADIEFQASRTLRIRAAHESIRHKHAAFAHEAEWRMVVFGTVPTRSNRPCRGVPVPFVPLNIAREGDSLPIHEVRVGPGHASQGTVRAAILGTMDLLQGKCMRTDVEGMVVVSEIPYHAQ